MAENILILNYEFPPLGGGGAKASYFISKILVKKGYKVRVVTSSYRGLKRFEVVDGVEIVRIPALREKVESCSVIEMFSFILSGIIYFLFNLRKFKPDIIHTFFAVPTGIVSYAVSKTYGIPYILSLRGSDVPREEMKRFSLIYPMLKPMLKVILRNSRASVAVSNGLKDSAVACEPSLNVEVIPNGVDMKMFFPGEMYVDSRKIRILFVGRLISVKNISLILDVAADLMEKMKNEIKLLIVGAGSLENRLKKQVRELNIEENVKFLGQVPYLNMPEVYKEADVLVSASLVEGMPNVILEAMASGLPVVASDVAGNREVVDDGKTGYLFPSNDRKCLESRLFDLVNNKQARYNMGAEGRKKTGEIYSWEKVTGEYINLYQKVLRGK